MNWSDVMIVMLRALIGDYDKEEFSDVRLKQVLVIAAQFVIYDNDLDNEYTINVVTPSITPDPISLNDDDFVNLTVLKSACIIDMSNMRLAAAISGVEARCGPVALNTMRNMDGFRTLIERGYCAAYSEAQLAFQLDDTSYIKAILSPFSSSVFDPTDYSNVSLNDRNRDSRVIFQ